MFGSFKINPIKEFQSYDKYIPKKTCLYSTNYFVNYKYTVNTRTLNYFRNLINIIETFKTKISIVAPDKLFVLRVYIDENYLKDDAVNKIQLHKKENNTKNVLNTINNLNIEASFLLFLLSTIKQYIRRIIESKDDRYSNIEIYTYNSKKYKLHRANEEDISGIVETCGTLIRLHSLFDERIGYCAMRNCSDNISVLDIKMHEYWMDNNPDIQYLHYNFATNPYDKNLRYSFNEKDLNLNKMAINMRLSIFF